MKFCIESFYNLDTREFAIRDQCTGQFRAVGYPTYYCVKEHPCGDGVRINMGCSTENKEVYKTCPGKFIFFHDKTRDLTEEEIKQMLSEERPWIRLS